MQKIINGIAIFSGAVALGIVGGGLPDLGGTPDSAIPPVGEGFGIPSF